MSLRLVGEGAGYRDVDFELLASRFEQPSPEPSMLPDTTLEMNIVADAAKLRGHILPAGNLNFQATYKSKTLHREPHIEGELRYHRVVQPFDTSAWEVPAYMQQWFDALLGTTVETIIDDPKAFFAAQPHWRIPIATPGELSYIDLEQRRRGSEDGGRRSWTLISSQRISQNHVGQDITHRYEYHLQREVDYPNDTGDRLPYAQEFEVKADVRPPQGASSRKVDRADVDPDYFDDLLAQPRPDGGVNRFIGALSGLELNKLIADDLSDPDLRLQVNANPFASPDVQTRPSLHLLRPDQDLRE